MTHLFKDYHTSWCGLDASYIPMTQDPASCDCTDCTTASGTAQAAEESAQQAAADQAEAEAQRTAATISARTDALVQQGDQTP